MHNILYMLPLVLYYAYRTIGEQLKSISVDKDTEKVTFDSSNNDRWIYYFQSGRNTCLFKTCSVRGLC